MRSLRKFSPSPALVVAAIALVAAAGGFAIAAVPDKQGRIEACYVPKTGAVKLLVKGKKCPRGQKLVRWNQTGPVGPAGAPGAAGSPAGSLLTGNTENITMSAGTTAWLAPSGPSQIWGDVRFAEMLSPNAAIVARDLSVQLGNEPGAGESYKITFLVDGSSTALTCTVSGLDKTCADGANAVTVPAGSRMALQVEVSGGAVPRRVLFGWRALTP